MLLNKSSHRALATAQRGQGILSVPHVARPNFSLQQSCRPSLVPPVSALETHKTPAQSGLAPPPLKPNEPGKEHIPALTKESSRYDGLKATPSSSQDRSPAPKGVVPNRPILSAGDTPLPKQGHKQSTGLLRLFSGSANKALAQEVAHYLGMELGGITSKRFADGEIYVQIQESIRGCDVFLIQPSCPPVNDNLMELLIMIDACKRASARSITAVIPYYGYARADRKVKGRESIAAKLTANLITEAGADRVLAMDIHSGQCVGYFDIPVDHIFGESVILDYLASKRIQTGDLVVVSPDVGGVARARGFAKKLNDAPLAIVDKRRSGHNVSEVMNLIGDVRGKVAVLVDDMIDTAGTISQAAKILRQEGAREVYACTSHPVFSPPAIERLSSGVFEEVIVTNTIPIPPENVFPELTILSVANLLGETIWRVYNATSVQALRD
uniref:ribose-phosphate diphosphokinase n=1 Tax=Dunaliella tertiolecta TaxID=3047 RepID=A0A7S3QM30_DUNTE|mmetsp:Transcript_17399/g.48332  ORF Transcript_17399/g.48332 Transcript_17399/m.48332 type:complete len:441 (+) Transcript_17399:149-1471(+)|eukprot:CAMPEP_0202347878 /NCGR_PEP_ID=MMETSP1126-20121109/6056_1 /ASSEMBLY_ACC=CAM_ASM_000457 /TAXON_ID=3047 /ORGANISM="Dunaliella tertiolecta, Strain CCMP1320" /LENGTH=440 /DNA_ID=CAMNT_0048939501 /DNA_START=118 /DNA_END=1440 /DNA_ORIENTATION=+